MPLMLICLSIITFMIRFTKFHIGLGFTETALTLHGFTGSNISKTGRYSCTQTSTNRSPYYIDDPLTHWAKNKRSK